MSNEDHVRLVRKALETSASLREPFVRQSGGTTASWRALLLDSAYKGDWNAFERTYLERFALVWFGDFNPRSGQARIPAGTPLDLSGEDLQGGLFAKRIFGADSPFEGANLRGTNLDDSEWLAMDLVAADLSRASLKNAFLLKVMCQGADFRGADLTGAMLALIETDGVFRGASLAKAGTPVDFSSANLSGARIVLGFPLQMRLEDANLAGCAISYVPPKDKDQKAKFDRRLDEIAAGLSDRQRSDVILERPDVKKGKCFLATAACGSEDGREVSTLQDFRDSVMRPSAWGARLVAVYERLSPPLAKAVEGSRTARWIVRNAIVDPAARFSAWVLRKRGRSS